MSPMSDELRREVRQLIDEAVRGTVDVRNHLQTQIQLEMVEARLANLGGGEQGVDAGGGATPAPLPFSVRYEEAAVAWQVYLPEGSLWVDGEAVAPEAGEAAGGGWYALAGLGEAPEAVYLHVGADGEGAPRAWLSGAAEAQARFTVKVCAVAGRTVTQLAAGALALALGRPDGASLDAAGAGGALQLAAFNGDGRDSPAGLAERLAVDAESGTVSVTSGRNIMLVGRRDGEIVYIPLSADGTDPKDDADGRDDPCEHPQGGAAGVDPSADEGHGAGGAAGGAGGGGAAGAGGVAAGGDAHQGDSGCNC